VSEQSFATLCPDQVNDSHEQQGDAVFFARCIRLVAMLWFCASIQATQGASLSICSFNIQFLGHSTSRDNSGLADLISRHDIVVVQELVAPPYPGTFPDGTPFRPDAESREFFERMKDAGFEFILSEEDTGPGVRNHLNSSATEWWVAFYKSSSVMPAPDLPSGFLATDRTRNRDFKRVPYAFAFRARDGTLDFVLISVHLQPGAGRVNKAARRHELVSIARWIDRQDGDERDFIVLGDMNIENAQELEGAVPESLNSLNSQCHPTNTNVNGPKRYDHVLFRPEFTGEEIGHGFGITDLIVEMRPRWTSLSRRTYPGSPRYNHNEFRKYYSDHHPVVFTLRSLPSGDDD
jgi:hypothetical protein